ncbi:hypothetical protein VOLCADRAFT_90667 [Volvox carteri f. nagariensis]|uniref:TFIIB-type domain-containing protein n=1 Tax=Volvox carteri f. nagariensis TaxID=3068 RepID=D8TV07_VOLCA|nr:uncharacterized protein VOLCADRAFT_90667 [Volvox carteri f. nagariensis]EFJ48803.1 hypothetical protein VOLCADRAFT_90667 [Volvox carteri f. nagariensis]|eukprot:XP_002950135.1 hypothetical protein VOLCADRAFT_90667 [Volvox carteri f. nagariensis]
MDAEGDLCTRCGAHAVSYDYGASCCVCQNCGFVSQQHELVAYQEIADTQQGNPIGGHFAVTAAYGAEALYISRCLELMRQSGSSTHGTGGQTGGTGGVAAAPPYPVGNDGASARARRQRQELSNLEGLATALRLPGPITQVAAGFLARIHQAASGTAAARRYGYGGDNAGAVPGCSGNGNRGDEDKRADGAWDISPNAETGVTEAKEAPPSSSVSTAARPALPATGGQESCARLGALLYLASRSERGTLTLAEVAMATCTDIFRVGEMARQQAAFLQLSLPAVDVERFVMRMARELVASGQLQQQESTTEAAPVAAEGGAAGGGGGDDLLDGGAEAAAAPVSETALWSHPLVRKTSQLTELVMRKGWHEGRSPRTVAAVAEHHVRGQPVMGPEAGGNVFKWNLVPTGFINGQGPRLYKYMYIS